MNGYKEILGFYISLKLVNDISLDLCVRVCTSVCVYTCISSLGAAAESLYGDTQTQYRQVKIEL